MFQVYVSVFCLRILRFLSSLVLELRFILVQMNGVCVYGVENKENCEDIFLSGVILLTVAGHTSSPHEREIIITIPDCSFITYFHKKNLDNGK